jgi:protein ImuB
MALWLALTLPALPLQLAARALGSEAAALPLVVTDGPAQRPLVAFCNGCAQDAGIHPGLKLAAAQALAQTLIAQPRQPERESAALHELACWAYQFSGAITPLHTDPDPGLLMEIGGSLRLFGGRALLLRRLRAELTGLGYQGCAAIAPTPLAARWMALARRRRLPAARDVLSVDELAAALDPLPLAICCASAERQPLLATLDALGLHALGPLRRLPRAGLRRRIGAALLDDIDRALGIRPDPQPAFEPPARFEARIDLPADLTDSARLMIPAERLLRSLEGFLRGRDAGATRLEFSALHSPRRAQPVPPTGIVLTLAAPERDAARLSRLLAERLTRVQLPEPAIALRLCVETLQRFAAVNASLLPPAPTHDGADAGWLHLAETLHARLGSQRVFQLQTVDDHRPEHAQRQVPLAALAPMPDPAATPSAEAPAPLRPMLLLPQPHPLPIDTAADSDDPPPAYGGPLTLIAGPERIEAGWWTLGPEARNSAVHRDYFIARNARGQTLWVFRELAAPRGWFLHGFFA